jgi:hypothetical protein
MREKLRTLNGWQRLWLVGTLIVFVYQAGIEPLKASFNTRQTLNELYTDARVDFATPQCEPYQTANFLSLAEPKGGEFKPGSCSHIWRTRAQSENPNRPYLRTDFEKMINDSENKTFRWNMLLGFIQALVFSAVMYFAGSVIAWILRGFKQNKQQ